MGNSLKNPEIRKPLVLLVDDVIDNLRVVGNILGEDNLEIIVATSGNEALIIASEELPDLILLDVMMPGMDGFETCKQLKQNLSTATIPVIFLTARTEIEDAVHGFDVGAVDYVTKPFHPAELRARVRTQLQMRQLKGLLSVCSYCGKIRENKDRWERLEVYISLHTKTRFSHGICPDCIEKHAAAWGVSIDELLRFQKSEEE